MKGDNMSPELVKRLQETPYDELVAEVHVMCQLYGEEIIVDTISALPRDQQLFILNLLLNGTDTVYYIRVDDDDFVIGESQLSGYITEITHPDTYMYMREVPDMDSSRIGTFYNDGDYTQPDLYATLDPSGNVIQIIPRNPKRVEPVAIAPRTITGIELINFKNANMLMDCTGDSVECQEILVDSHVQVGMRRVNGEFIVPDLEREHDEHLAKMTAIELFAMMKE